MSKRSNSESSRKRVPVEKCRGCNYTVRELIIMCEQPNLIEKFLLSHDCVPQAVLCTTCHRPARLNWARRSFRCQKSVLDKKTGEIKKCKFYQSCLKGTLFEDGKLGIDKVLIMIAYWLCLPPPRQAFLCSDLRISSKSAVEWQARSRALTEDWMETRSLQQIGGVDKNGKREIVEIDEAKIGKRFNNKGRRVEGQWVFGGVVRSDPTRTFVEPVEKRDKQTLLAIIQERILPGTIIVSDCWRAYMCLGDEGYEHWKVNHSVEFVNPDGETHTQNIERMWREVRANVPRYGRRNDRWLGYLSEFAFKRAYRRRPDRIHEFFTHAGDAFFPENRCAPPLHHEVSKRKRLR